MEIPSRIDADDSIMFSFIVSGDGNLNLLDFNFESKDFKVYKDKDESIVLPGGELQEARKLTYLLIPQKSGKIKIPSFSAKYFDPFDKYYKQLLVGGSEVFVGGQVRNESPVDIKERSGNEKSKDKKILSKTEKASQLEGGPNRSKELFEIAESDVIYNVVNWIILKTDLLIYASTIFSFLLIIFLNLKQLTMSSLFSFRSRQVGNIDQSISHLIGKKLVVADLDIVFEAHERAVFSCS